MAIFAVLFVILMELTMGGAGNKVQEKQLEFLENAVRRAAVQSYALEGRYPSNLAYLEENYGLIIDRNNYIVHYELMLGDDTLPYIRVMPVMTSK